VPPVSAPDLDGILQGKGEARRAAAGELRGIVNRASPTLLMRELELHRVIL